MCPHAASFQTFCCLLLVAAEIVPKHPEHKGRAGGETQSAPRNIRGSCVQAVVTQHIPCTPGTAFRTKYMLTLTKEFILMVSLKVRIVSLDF